jgi:hypothetical protein
MNTDWRDHFKDHSAAFRGGDLELKPCHPGRL